MTGKLDTSKVCFLFDGDLLVYRAGFSAERRRYKLNPGTGRTKVSWTNISAAKNYCALHGLPESAITWERVAEPEYIAKNNMDKLIEGTYKSFADTTKNLGFKLLQEHCSIFFLTGCDIVPNFREVISHEYKANRDPAHKPTHLSALRRHLVDEYKTVITQGAETDDYLGQALRDSILTFPDMLPVIVSLDKDLLTVPGFHYNFKTKTFAVITEEIADYNFFIQMLVGDTADNISAIKGVGPKKAEKHLQPVANDAMQLAFRTWRLYEINFGTDARIKWDMNCNLLWIWRKVPDVCPWIGYEGQANW